MCLNKNNDNARFHLVQFDPARWRLMIIPFSTWCVVTLISCSYAHIFVHLFSFFEDISRKFSWLSFPRSTKRVESTLIPFLRDFYRLGVFSVISLHNISTKRSKNSSFFSCHYGKKLLLSLFLTPRFVKTLQEASLRRRAKIFY